MTVMSVSCRLTQGSESKTSVTDCEEATYMPSFISYETICGGVNHNIELRQRTGTYIARVIDEVVTDPREHVQAHEYVLHMIVDVRLHPCY